MFNNALIVTVFSDVCKIQALIPVLAALQFQKIMLGVSLFGIIKTAPLQNNLIRAFKSPRGRILLLFFLWMVLSIPFSIYPGASFQFITESYWKLLVTLALIIAYGSTMEMYDKMIWAVLCAVSIFSVTAVVSADSGRFSFVETYDPNENALLFVWSMPFAFWKMVGMRGWKKMLLAAMLFFSVVGIIETQSRGGFIGLIVVVVLTLVQYRKVKKIGLLSLVIMPLLLAVVVYVKGGTTYVERITSIFDTEQNYNYSGEEGRLQIWKEGLTMMIDNPVLGVGVNAFIAAHGALFRGMNKAWQAAHNSYIQVGAELGIPGLLMFCYLIGSNMRAVSRIAHARVNVRNRVPVDIYNAFSLIGAWTGFITCAIFLSVAHSNIFYILLGLSFVFINLEAHRRTDMRTQG